jgi:hypothetical protein
MKNLYYRIWVELIVVIMKNPQNKNNWLFYSMFFMTMLCSINLLTILLWLGAIGIKTNFLKITLFPGTMLDSFAMFVIQFALPCFLLNYFLIFYKEKYKKLIERYTEKKGKLFLIYMLSTIGAFIIPVLFYWWLH